MTTHASNPNHHGAIAAVTSTTSAGASASAAASGTTPTPTRRARVASSVNARRWGRRPLTMHEVMTPQPVTIGRKETLATAHAMMREHGCRHLPVLEHGELVGVVSQRDLYLLETIGGVDLTGDDVDDAMTADAYAVEPTALLDEVAARMADDKIGCAVVIERGRVVGIFTTTDALRVLAGRVP